MDEYNKITILYKYNLQRQWYLVWPVYRVKLNLLRESK